MLYFRVEEHILPRLLVPVCMLFSRASLMSDSGAAGCAVGALFPPAA
jgi:hypothetical protein